MSKFLDAGHPTGHDSCIGKACDEPTYDNGREGGDYCVAHCDQSKSKEGPGDKGYVPSGTKPSGTKPGGGGGTPPKTTPTPETPDETFSIDELRFLRAVATYGDPRGWGNANNRPNCEDWAPAEHCQASLEGGVMMVAGLLEIASIVGAEVGAASTGLSIGRAAQESGTVTELQATSSRLRDLLAREYDRPWLASTPFRRGDLMEYTKNVVSQLERLGTKLHHNFPRIDFMNYETGHATSLKSLDLALGRYGNPAVLGSRLKGYVDRLASFDGTSFAGDVIRGQSIKSRELLVAVNRDFITNPKALSAGQFAAIQRAGEYAATQKVDLRFVFVP